MITVLDNYIAVGTDFTTELSFRHSIDRSDIPVQFPDVSQSLRDGTSYTERQIEA
jgi:hypothetical protein